jgi:hypothetical protein
LQGIIYRKTNFYLTNDSYHGRKVSIEKKGFAGQESRAMLIALILSVFRDQGMNRAKNIYFSVLLKRNIHGYRLTI